METLTFEQWLQEEGYDQIHSMKENMIVDDKNEDEIRDEIERLENEYEDYVEEMNQT